MQPEGEGRVLVEPPFLGQRVFLPALAFQGTVDHQVEHPIFGRRKCGQRFAHQPVQHLFPLPPPRGQQPAQMPGRHVRRRIPRQPLHRRFAKTHQMRDQQPAKDQVMAIAEVGLERREQTRYFLRQPGHPDHGGPPGQGRLMSLNHPSAYLPGGPPARTPLLRLLCWRAPKRQDYQETIPLNLSTLSK